MNLEGEVVVSVDAMFPAGPAASNYCFLYEWRPSVEQYLHDKQQATCTLVTRSLGPLSLRTVGLAQSCMLHSQ